MKHTSQAETQSHPTLLARYLQLVARFLNNEDPSHDEVVDVEEGVPPDQTGFDDQVVGSVHQRDQHARVNRLRVNGGMGVNQGAAA